MPTLTVVMGIPGSGKTTWAKQHAHTTGAVLISTDDIRTHNRNVVTAFNDIHTRAEQVLTAGTDVVIDACNLNRKHRLRWLRIARQTNTPTTPSPAPPATGNHAP